MRALGAYWGLLSGSFDLPLLGTGRESDLRYVPRRRCAAGRCGRAPLAPGRRPRSSGLATRSRSRIETERRRIARFDRYASGIYALNPDLLGVLPARARFVPFADVRPVAEVGAVGTEAIEFRSTGPSRPHEPPVHGDAFPRGPSRASRGKVFPVEFELLFDRARLRSIPRSADVVQDRSCRAGTEPGGRGDGSRAARSHVTPGGRSSRTFRRRCAPRSPSSGRSRARSYEVLEQLLTERRGELAALGRHGRDYVRRSARPARTVRARAGSRVRGRRGKASPLASIASSKRLSQRTKFSQRHADASTGRSCPRESPASALALA